MKKNIPKPQEGEFPAYASRYINLIPNDGLIFHHLREKYNKTKAFILSLSEDKLTFVDAPGKWTIKEILLHISDDERIYAYRALAYARNDHALLPGFNENLYAKESFANQRSIEDILQEFKTVREATIGLFSGFPENV